MASSSHTARFSSRLLRFAPAGVRTGTHVPRSLGAAGLAPHTQNGFIVKEDPNDQLKIFEDFYSSKIDPDHAGTPATAAAAAAATYPKLTHPNVTTQPEVLPPVTTDAQAQITAKVVLESVMRSLPDPKPKLPSEIIWLNGAPASGKGTNTQFILEARGLSTRPIQMSEVLGKNREARSLIDQGEMIPDSLVVQALMQELIQPENSQGVLVDGFPRTTVQVECLAMLYNKMNQMRRNAVSIHEPNPFPKPKFLIAVLYITEKESIQRQAVRGAKAAKQSARVRDMMSMDNDIEIRQTDLDGDKASKRYQIYKQHRAALYKLHSRFPFTVIDAEDNIDKVRDRILAEFKYQSSQELRPETYDMIASVPLADSIKHNARPALVERLDRYAKYQEILFQRAIDTVNQKVGPKVKRAAFAGAVRLLVNESEGRVWQNPIFVDMFVDVLSERGYRCQHETMRTFKPAMIDQKTWRITCEEQLSHVFIVEYPAAELSRHGLERD